MAISATPGHANECVRARDDDDHVHDDHDDDVRDCNLHCVDAHHRHESPAVAVVMGKDQRDSPVICSDPDPAPIVLADPRVSDTAA